MTTLRALPELLTITEYLDLPEDCYGPRQELVEGQFVVTPSPTYWHNKASGELYHHLRSQLPAQFRVIQDIDVDLALVPAGDPATVRRPDLAVADATFEDRLRRTRKTVLRADEVRVVIEIVSPGSGRGDRIFKLADYADAGIPHYWIVSTEPVVSLQRFRLVPGHGYEAVGDYTGVFETTEPFAFTVDLDSLI